MVKEESFGMPSALAAIARIADARAACDELGMLMLVTKQCGILPNKVPGCTVLQLMYSTRS